MKNGTAELYRETERHSKPSSGWPQVDFGISVNENQQSSTGRCNPGPYNDTFRKKAGMGLEKFWEPSVSLWQQ